MLAVLGGDISIKTARRWAMRKGLPIRQIGRTIIANPAETEAWKRKAKIYRGG